MITVPLSAIVEGSAIILRGDALVDSECQDPRFERRLNVYKAYPGRPHGEDMSSMRGFEYVEAGSSRGEQDEGVTLLVAGADHRGMVIFFPDDQYEVAVLEDGDG